METRFLSRLWRFGKYPLAGLVGVIFTSCAEQVVPGRVTQARAAEPPTEKYAFDDLCFDSVVFIAIDGVAPADVFFGQDDDSARVRPRLPQLREMGSSGAAWGDPLSNGFFASGPNFVSLPG